VGEVTVADRGLREGMLLRMIRTTQTHRGALRRPTLLQ
jgi:exopolyphosphatase/pppGpp-phosphohydrolase